MKSPRHVPMLLKMLLWLLMHLAVLGIVFMGFLGWQLQLGLDSLLSGAAGERLRSLGVGLAAELRAAPRERWESLLEARLEPYGVRAYLRLEDGSWATAEPAELPDRLQPRITSFGTPARQRSRSPQDPPERPRAGHPREGFRGPGERGPGPPRSPGRPGAGPPVARTLFLERIPGAGYWAGIDLPLFEPRVEPPLHGMLLIHSSSPAGGGLFFDIQPWLLGGLGVLSLSLLIWAPFVIGITNYTRRLSRATEAISEGRFRVHIRGQRHDELGSVGRSIETMGSRLERLVDGQKRFLGDVAHELCSPLARIRTGLGVLEQGLDAGQRERLESIEEDVAELSELVSEVLVFTRTSTAPESVRPEVVELRPLVERALARECSGHSTQLEVPPGLAVRADPKLLARAVANLLRNCHRHAGADCEIRVHAGREGDEVVLGIEDNGPGVPAETLPALFEPFYRTDESRARESGGAGLGLAIVRGAIEACGGAVEAWPARPSGLQILMRLPVAEAASAASENAPKNPPERY